MTVGIIYLIRHSPTGQWVFGDILWTDHLTDNVNEAKIYRRLTDADKFIYQNTIAFNKGWSKISSAFYEIVKIEMIEKGK